MNLHFKRAILLPCISCLLLIAFCNSCKRQAEPSGFNNQELLSKFFPQESITDSDIKIFCSEAARQNQKLNFVPAFVKDKGYILWNKAEKVITDSGVLALLPVKHTTENKITAYITALRSNEGRLAFHVYKSSQLKNYSFDLSQDINAIKVQGIISYFEMKLFRQSSFDIFDERQLLDKGNRSFNLQTKKYFAKVKIKENDGMQIETTCVTLYEEVEVWWNPSGSNDDGDEEYVYSYFIPTPQCYPSGDQYVNPADWDGNNGGHGGSGGGTPQTFSIGEALSSLITLSQEQKDFLGTETSTVNPLAMEIYVFLAANLTPDFTQEEKASLMQSHINYLMTNAAYRNYCNSQIVYTTPQYYGELPFLLQSVWFAPDRLITNQSLYSNISKLKLNAEQAYYLLNTQTISSQINQFLVINNFSEQSKARVISLLQERINNVLYNQNDPFAFPNSPVNVPDEQVISNGIELVDIPQALPGGPPKRIIGRTTPRGNTEDLSHGTTGDVTGIAQIEIPKTPAQLIDGMKSLINFFTVFDTELNTVGKSMIEYFKTNTNNQNQFSNQTLNDKVKESAGLSIFLKQFGNKLRDELIAKNGNINLVQEINMQNIRPIFNGLHNQFHGLQIIINDTEETEIQLDRFEIFPSGDWEADVTVTIYDHFGLDKHDALEYQGWHLGFADWWLLQHKYNYVPFKTKITVRKMIKGKI